MRYQSRWIPCARRRADNAVLERPTRSQHEITYAPALEGRRVAVFGDIHGRADLLAKAQDSLDRYVGRIGFDPPLEIYLGDYIDRGPESRTVLDMLLSRRRSHAVVCLRGNHEAMLLDVLHDVSALPHWLACGGGATLTSYGSDMLSDAIGEAARGNRSELEARIPREHRSFLTSMPIAYRLGSMFFVHAGVRPGILLERQRDADMLWIREPFLSSKGNHGALIVHGHTPVATVDFRHNRINVDTGAVFTGRLTCLLIADDALRVIA